MLSLKKAVVVFATGIGLFSWVVLYTRTSAETPHEVQMVQVAETPIVEVELLPELIPICTCESGYKHYDSNGDVLRGRINNLDVGICQINLGYHQEYAVKLGLDLMNENDNKTFANVLYTEQGSRPWKWSAACWDK